MISVYDRYLEKRAKQLNSTPAPIGSTYESNVEHNCLGRPK